MYAVGILLLLLGALEVALRFLGSEVVHFASAYRKTHLYDRALLHTLTPNTSAPFTLTHRDGKPLYDFHLALNNEGFRETDSSFKLKDTKKKIVHCLGDSMTLGWGVAQEESYPEVLEKRLGEKFAVLNLGVDRRGSLACVEVERTQSEIAKPAYVVFLLCENDFENDTELVAFRGRSELHHLAAATWDGIARYSYIALLPESLGWQAAFGPLLEKPRIIRPFSRQMRVDAPEFKAKVKSLPLQEHPTLTGIGELAKICEANDSKLLLCLLVDTPNMAAVARYANEQGIRWTSVFGDQTWYLPGEDAHYRAEANSLLASVLSQRILSLDRLAR